MGSDVNQSTVDSAAVFLFTLFRSDSQWSRSHAEEIRRTLGPYPATAGTRACNTVKRILSCLPESEKADSANEKTAVEGSAVKMKKEFGHNIPFRFDSLPERGEEVKTLELFDKGSVSKTTSCQNGYDSLSDEENPTPSLLTSTILNAATYKEASQEAKQPESKQPTQLSTAEASATALYSGGWLREKCKKCLREQVAGITWEELYSAVFEFLSSTEDNAVIQNDVRERKESVEDRQSVYYK